MLRGPLDDTPLGKEGVILTVRVMVRYFITGLTLLIASCRASPISVVDPTVTPSRTAQPASTEARPTNAAVLTSTLAPVPTSPRLTSTASPYPEEDLHLVTDDTGAISASIPVVWSDLRTIPWIDSAGKTIGTTLIASTDIEAYLSWRVEGVSISASRRLGRGYIQLLDEEYAIYSGLCTDPFFTRWDFENEYHRGKYYALVDCGGVEDGWLRLIAVVGRGDPQAYTARVLAYDMIPIFGDTFGDILMMFQVNPENLP